MVTKRIPDYYAVLGVGRSASKDEIHRAYRRLARLVHPDVRPDERSHLVDSPDIRLVNQAWDVLGDPESRAAYDHLTQPKRAPVRDQEWDPFGVALPRVPEGFELHPRKGWYASAGWYRQRFADARHQALSLAAETDDLSNLSQLEDGDVWFLDLSRLPVTDADLRPLSRFQRLAVLHVDGTQVTDAGLEGLRRFPLLHTLTLTGCRVTDAGIPALSSIPHLQNLEIDETDVTDEGLAAFAGHSSLIVLDIRKTKVRGSGLCHLTEIPTLRELRVSGWAELAAMRTFRGRREVAIL